VFEFFVLYLIFFGKVETQKYFLLECLAFKDNRESYTDMLATSSWDNLFSQGFVEKLKAFILKLSR